MEMEMEMEAYRRLFPLQYFERHLLESVRPDARPLHAARPTTIELGTVANANGSALVTIGDTTMVASIKLEVMSPSAESPDEGSVAVEFNMPPICSPAVRPGRPAEVAPAISKQLSDVIISSGMINMKELSLVTGKAAWMAYLDIYCLNADGSLFDAALLSAVAAFSHLELPHVSVNDAGRVFIVSEELVEHESKEELVDKEKRKLSLDRMAFSFTCVIHKKYILPDPTAEEESIMETLMTVVLDQYEQLVAIHKAGGAVLAHTETIKDCIALTKHRAKELLDILTRSKSSVAQTKTIYGG